MEEMRDLVMKATQEGLPTHNNGPNIIFAQVMGPESRGFIRCYGKGTPKTVWGESSKAASHRNNEEVSSLKRKVEYVEDELSSTRDELNSTRDELSSTRDELKKTRSALAEVQAYFKRVFNGELHIPPPDFARESSPTSTSSATQSG